MFLKLGENLPIPCKWGERNQSSRKSIETPPYEDWGIDAQSTPLPKAFGKEPFKVGPTGTMTDWTKDNVLCPQIQTLSEPLTQFFAPMLFFLSSLLPFLPLHTPE